MPALPGERIKSAIHWLRPFRGGRISSRIIGRIAAPLACAVLRSLGLFGLAPGSFLGAPFGLFVGLGGLSALALQAVLRIARGSGRHLIYSWGMGLLVH